MQGKQVLEQPLFVSGDLDKFIPATHRLRKVDRILDFSFVADLAKPHYCQNNGRTSIDPVVFFKMQVIKYLYGIPSDRQLCDDVQVNLAFRWFLRLSIEDKVPDHSALSKIRDRLGEDLFRHVFERIVAQCKRTGLIVGKQILSDATLIEADAAKSSLELRADANGDMPTEEPERISMKTHVSATDPDATLVGRPGVPTRLYYKGHFSIDGGSARIITDAHVTTGAAHECKILPGRVEYQLSRFELTPEEWLADGGYGHGPTYDFFRDKGIRTYIPLRDPKLGNGKYAPPEGFKYDRKGDRYICPQGHALLPHKPSDGFTRYRIVGDHCKTCPLRESCFTAHDGNGSKRIQRSSHQDSFDAVHRRRLTKHFRRKIRERGWKMEGVFAEDKTNHGLRRAHYRGRAKVQMQVYMIAAVHNLKRLAEAFGDHFITIWCKTCSQILQKRILTRFFAFKLQISI